MPESCFKADIPGFIHLRSNGKSEPLTNFLAWIERQQVHDDGATVQRFYEIAAGFAVESVNGMLRTERDHQVIVPAREFEEMDWVAEYLGCDFQILQPGRKGKDLTAKAIQWFTAQQGGVPEEILFKHTGWRQVDGVWCYLHSKGAIGATGIQTDLTTERLQRYALRGPGSPAEIRAAVKTSLALLELGPERIMYPLLAAVYRAPLVHHVPCTVLPHLVGASGAFKSTLAALMLSHYGAFHGKEELPANWRFTPAALEKLLFLSKDVLIVIDDLFPEEIAAQRFQMEATFSKIVGAVGDAKGKLRGSPNMTLRPEYYPRGVVLSTGEYTPTFSQSRHARVLTIPIAKGDISNARLSQAQRGANSLPVAMAGYVAYLQQNFDHLGPQLNADLEYLRTSLSTHHPRIAENAAHMLLGLKALLRFAVDCGTKQSEADGHFEKGQEALSELATQQAQGVEDADPTAEFIQILKEALSSRIAYLVSRSDGAFREGGNETELLGYVDDRAVYLLPETCFKFVNKFMREKGRGPVNEKYLKRSLVEKGLLFNCEASRFDRTTKCNGRSLRVMWIRRSALLDDATPENQTKRLDDRTEFEGLPEVIQ